jgi:dipeptidyl aminopeptidase/acylaminoacyl peptidase
VLKKLSFSIFILVAISIGAALFVTRNSAPTHPVLRASDLPPLIPTRSFYADHRASSGYVASHDGSLVSFEKSSLTGRNIVVKNVTTGKEISKFPIGLSFIRWHPTKPLLRFIFEGHDWEADPYSSDRKNWQRTSPVKLSGGWAKNQIATDETMPILTWGKSHSRWDGHMWLVSQDGLIAEKIAEGNSNTQYWVFDDETKPVLRLDSLDPATTRLFKKTSDSWEKLIDVDLGDNFFPLSHVFADGSLIVRSSRGRDKAALVSMNVETGNETVLVENPEADIAWTTALTPAQIPDIVRMGFDTMERVALTDRGTVFLDILAQFPQPVTLGQTTPTASGRYVTQAISVQSKSYIHLLIDLEEKSYVTLAEHGLRRFKDHLVLEQAVTFKARDGLDIPAVLTMPKNVTGPIPFIVYIHGGPAGHTTLGYGHGTQLLVNRGYGVLSVNFRGSTGFGKAYQAKGFKEFGRAMQDDIADAANWLVSEGLADENALVAMGISYGGYSAALAMTRDPGLFDAAIVEFPMLDVEFQSKYHPGFWDDGIDGWWRYFGKTDNANDLVSMKEFSPSNRINQLHGPILLMGGERDQITAVQQVKDFETAALAASKNVEAHYFPNAGHGVNHWRDRLRRARLMEEFLAKYAGGRSGGFEFAERAPAFID